MKQIKKIALLFWVSMIIISPKYALANDKADFVVAQDGSGNFKTVQDAINAVPDFRKVTTTIFIKNGVYKEKLILAASKRMVKLIGESQDKTILTYDDFAQKKNVFGEEKGTSGSASFYIYGDDFTAENITFQNSSGPVGQAVAVWAGGDKTHFKNCKFLGFQDTLYTYGYGTRQFYEHCDIEGTTDFIFGSATAVFQECEIFCKKGGSYITAASTPDSTKFGYVFLNCKIIGETGASYFLGRPWRPYAKVVFMESDLGDFIKPEGWDFWGKESNKETAYYSEYKNKGIGFKPDERVKWAHQLNEEEAKNYTLFTVLRGWDPKLINQK